MVTLSQIIAHGSIDAAVAAARTDSTVQLPDRGQMIAALAEHGRPALDAIAALRARYSGDRDFAVEIEVVSVFFAALAEVREQQPPP